MTIKRGTQAKILLPGKMIVNNVPIFIEETEIGCVSEMVVEISANLETLHTVESWSAQRFIEGNLKITGTIRRAWVNLFYLNLLGITQEKGRWNEVLFDLLIKSGNNILYLRNCKFTSSDIRITSDGWLEEEYDFVGGASEVKEFEVKEPTLKPGIYLSVLPPNPGAPSQTDPSNFPNVRGSSQRRTFWHQGYGYIFIAEYTNELGDIVYNSTSDGVNYTKPTIGNPVITREELGNTDWSYHYDILYDGTYVYAVVVKQVAGGTLKIKRGTPSGGIISWGSWITIYTAPSNLFPVMPSLTKTNNGYFWVAYTIRPTSAPYYFDVYCVRSSQPNSIDSWNSPVLIFDENQYTGFKNCAVVPMSDSSVYVMYYRYGYNVYGHTFDGSNVGAQEDVSVYSLNGVESWGANSDGYNNVCILYQRYTDSKIFLRRRLSSGWESPIETPIVPAPSYFNGISLTATNSSKLYLFYNEEINDPYYKFYYRTWDPSSGFSAPTLLADNERITSDLNEEICSSRKIENGILMGLWFRSVSPPAPVRCVTVAGLS